MLMKTQQRNPSVIVIGAGMTGILMAIKLAVKDGDPDHGYSAFAALHGLDLRGVAEVEHEVGHRHPHIARGRLQAEPDGNGAG